MASGAPGGPEDPQPPDAPRRWRGQPLLSAVDPTEQWAAIIQVLRGIVLGSVVGAAAGTASAVFLYGLALATDRQQEIPWLLYLLPVAGAATGLLYARLGGRSGEGTGLVVAALHQDDAGIQRLPLRMAPLVLVGTWATHLFGGSAGREGTAMQMGASLADGIARLLPLRPEERRLLLLAGVAGGFGSVFGVPVAGAVFALEVRSVGRLRHEAIVPALVASITGTLVFGLWDLPHDVTPSPQLPPVALDPPLLLGIALAAVAFGLTSAAFVELTEGLRNLLARHVRWAWLRPAVGGTAVVLLVLALGTVSEDPRAYVGLSLPLIDQAFDAGDVFAFAFLVKLVLTAVTLASGFQGGEVTPLFVIGATLGAVLGGVLSPVLGGPVELYVAAGFIAVFAAATNTPIACTVMGVELFGAAALPHLALACAIAYTCSLHRGIYGTQQIGTPKLLGRTQILEGTTLHDERLRRRPR